MKNSILKSSVIVFTLLSTSSFSQVALDFSFNNSGTAVTAIGAESDRAFAVAVQSDGKILVTGATYGSSDYHFAAVRYNLDGTLDSSFDGDGIVVLGFTGNSNDILIQPDGKIVLGGTGKIGSSYYHTLVRLLANGSLDTTFAGDGIVHEMVGMGGGIGSLALQSDGKIIAGGNVYLKRFLSNGSLDVSFNPDSLSFVSSMAYTDPLKVNLQTDGKILVSQWGFNLLDQYYFYLGRYNTDGTSDSTFNTYGELQITYPGELFQEASGSLVYAGGSYTSPEPNHGITRLNSFGAFDSMVSTNIGGEIFTPSSLIIQSDGKIIVYGDYNNGTSTDFALLRYNADLTPDTTFGSVSNYAITDFGQDDHARSGALMSDGRIVLAGYTTTNGTEDFAVARYHANGVGIDKIITENSFNVYPNPVSTQLTISSKSTFSNAQIKLIDISGQIILTQQNLNGKTITLDVSFQPAGMYVVEITEGNSVSRMKFAKH